MPHPHAPPDKKRSGEQSRISWAYSPKVVMTNEVARSVIITNLTTVKFVHLNLSIRTFFVGRKMFWSLLGYIVAKVCASPRNSTWFTRPFLLVRGWGLGTRLGGNGLGRIHIYPGHCQYLVSDLPAPHSVDGVLETLLESSSLPLPHVRHHLHTTHTHTHCSADRYKN